MRIHARLRESPAGAVARDFRVGLHADEDACALAWQGAGFGQRFAAGLQDRELLRKRLREVARREAQAVEIEFDNRHAAFAVGIEHASSGKHGVQEGIAVARARDHRTDANDGDWNSYARNWHVDDARIVFGNDQVGIVAAEPEC